MDSGEKNTKLRRIFSHKIQKNIENDSVKSKREREKKRKVNTTSGGNGTDR